MLSRGTIIGVVGDVRQRLRLPPEPEIYSSLAGTGYSAATLVVSASTPPDGLVGPVRAAIREINPNQTVFDVKTMEQVITASHADLDLFLWLIGGFAGLAFACRWRASTASSRTPWLPGGRNSAFAWPSARTPDACSGWCLHKAGLLIGGGVVVGIAGALALTRFLQALLYEVTPTDPITFDGRHTHARRGRNGRVPESCAPRNEASIPMTVLRHE